MTDKLAPSRIGDVAEFYAVTWLWDKGYEVFPNAGCTGPVDMIAMKGDEVLLIDVKTGAMADGCVASMSKTTNRTPLQKEMGVVILQFNPDTRQLRFTNHRENASTGHRDEFEPQQDLAFGDETD